MTNWMAAYLHDRRQVAKPTPFFQQQAVVLAINTGERHFTPDLLQRIPCCGF
jgi:hypothetical protein